jgi:manganese/iron transport system permease protein
MLRGFVAAIVIGIVGAVIGTYVVLRGMSFFGDALAHSILPGMAVGYLVSGASTGALFWWALGAAILSAFGIDAISKSTRIKEDTAIGVIFSGMFALGIALISTVRSYTVDLSHFLFGDILGVTNADLRLILIFSAIILVIVFFFFKEFLVMSFDPTLAITLRLPARLLDKLLLILIAITIVVALQAVGISLMVAMLITPAASAYLLTKRLPLMMLLAALFATFASIIGLYLSFYLSIASGAAIVLTTSAIFIIVWIVHSFKSRALQNSN